MNVVRKDCECCTPPPDDARKLVAISGTDASDANVCTSNSPEHAVSRVRNGIAGVNTGAVTAAVIAAPTNSDASPMAPSLPTLAIYGMLVFCVVSWASTYTAIKVAIVHFEPHHIAVLRFTVASLAMALFLPKAKPTMPSRADVGKLLLYGFTGIAVYNVLLCSAERTVNAGTASFVIGTAPVFASVLATFWLKEKLSRRGWAALAVAFAGAAIMSAGKTGGFNTGLDVVALLVAAFLSAVSLTVQKSLLNRISPLACAIYTVWAGTLLLLPFLPGALQAASRVEPSAVFSVVYLGLVPVGIGTLFWSFVMAHMPVGRAAAFLYLVPAIAAVLSAVLLRELPSSCELAGGAVIMLAVLASSPNFNDKLQGFVAMLKESMRTKPLCEDYE